MKYHSGQAASQTCSGISTYAIRDFWLSGKLGGKSNGL